MVTTFYVACMIRFISSKSFPKTSEYWCPDELGGRLLPWNLRLDATLKGALYRLFPFLLLRTIRKNPVWNGTSLTARVRFLDESVRSAVSDGATQLVILAAGLDTRCGRLRDVLKDVRVFEVDLPESQAVKRTALQRAGLADDWGCTFVPVNFRDKDWPVALQKAGCNLGGERAHVLWEGCIYYLPEESVKETLRALRKPGVSLSFDLTSKAVIGEGSDADDAGGVVDFVRSVGEPYLTGIDFDGLEQWATDQGWELTDTLCGKEDVNARFFPTKKEGVDPFNFHGMASMHPKFS